MRKFLDPSRVRRSVNRAEQLENRHVSLKWGLGGSQAENLSCIKVPVIEASL